MYPCFVCDSKSFQTANELISHVTILHSDRVRSCHLCCSQPLCTRTFDRLSSYSRHIRSHKVELPRVELRQCVEKSNEHKEETLHENVSENYCSSSDKSNDKTVSQCSVQDFDVSLSNAVLSFVGRLYSIDTLARSHVQLIIDCVVDLINGAHMKVLEAKAAQLGDLELNQLLHAMRDMFNGLETEHKRLNVFKESGAYIEPIQYVLGHSLDPRGNGVVEPVNLYGQFIPLTKTLKAFFELPGVFKATMDYIQKIDMQDGSVLENFIQGKLWREKVKPEFPGKIVLPLNLYYDDYLPGDTAGKHPHKIGGTYFNIPCIPPEYRSCLENIFLANIFYAEDKCFGPEEIFRRVLNEIEVLEQTGITIVVSGEEHVLYFALCLFLGDNLGVHQVLGFAEGFTANYFCRRCKMHKQHTHTQTKVDPSVYRDRVNYAHDVALKNVTSTGINNLCVWNRFKAFHCVENVCFDLMHDLDEGAWDYDMCLIISKLIERGRFTLETLNDRCQGLDYGPCEESNKPGLITVDHLINQKFKFTAAEKLCFVRNFGFMVGDKITATDEKLWRLYEVIHDLVSFLSCPKFRVVDAPIVEALVSEHHSLYLELFPGQTLKPKHHHMLHYGEALLNNGPLILLSCWRFEGKHRPFQRNAKVNCNFRNLPLTYAIKHQLKFCQRLLSQKGFETRVLTSKCQAIRTECLADWQSFGHLLAGGRFDQEAVSFKWIQINGIKYTTDMVLLLGFGEEYPIFGKIKHILSDKDLDRFSYVLKAFYTSAFSSRFVSFEVSERDEWHLVNHESLVTFVPTYDRIGPDGYRYVSFRYKL